VSESTRRLGAGCLVLVALVVLVSGCGRKAAAPPPFDLQASLEESDGPNEVELSDPKVTLVEPTLVQFEVKYRFTQGRPNQYHACDISFPGTPNHAVKMMDTWELKAEGVIKDGVVLSKPPVRTFEIRVSEADSPQNGYKKISNVVRGPVK